MGGWAALAMLVLPAVPGTAWASDGGRHGTTDGPGRPHLQSGAGAREGLRGDDSERDGDRREDDGERHEHRPQPGPGDSPVLVPVADPPAALPVVPGLQAPAADAEPPRLEIGTALGPISSSSGEQPARASSGAAEALSGNRRLPLLSFDAPSPFAPRSLAGALRDAPATATLQVAIRRGAPGRGCGWWVTRGARFTAPRRDGCRTARWITARLTPSAGGWRWRASLGGTLPAGNYRYSVRVLDGRGRPVAFQRI